MQVTARITLLEPEQMDFDQRPGAWCPGVATVSIQGEGGDMTVLKGLESGGWVGYGFAIPEALHGSAQAAGGHLGQRGSLHDFQVSLVDDVEWHAGRHGASEAVAGMSDEHVARICNVGADDKAALSDARDSLRQDIEHAIMTAEVEGLDDAEQTYLRALLAHRIAGSDATSHQRAKAEATASAIADEVNLAGYYECETDPAWLAAQLDMLPKHPIGRIDCDEDDRVEYVAVVYGEHGDEPGDCRVRWGTDDAGRWFVGDGDDDVGDVNVHGPYPDADVARAEAEALAAQQHEGTDGEDAEGMSERLRQDAKSRAVPDGRWVVAWKQEDGSMTVGRRYDSRDDAVLEINEWHRELYERYPTALAHLMTHPVLAELVPVGNTEGARWHDKLTANVAFVNIVEGVLVEVDGDDDVGGA